MSNFDAGKLTLRTWPEGVGEDFDGEKLCAELMAIAFAHSYVDTMTNPVIDELTDDGRENRQLAFDAVGWLRQLRERGWTVTTHGDGVTFSIVRG